MSTIPQRLPEPFGSLIERGQPIAFTFDGVEYQGLAGDTLASALAANGRLLISRSFKYHRPRGAWSWNGLDANAYVQVGDQPNVAADLLPLTEGLVAHSQNVWGSLDNDIGRFTGLLSRFLPVGFYYHTFFRPRGAWPYWEKLFRRTAGLGKISQDTRPAYYDKQYLFTDVAVVGSGPAGLEAALSAADQDARVLLIESAAVPGGALNYARFQRAPAEVAELRKTLVRRVQESANITLLTNTCCSGWFPDNWLALDGGQRLFKLRAREVIAATGSIEQPIVFRNNDLPGILPASGAQRLMRLYGILPGRKQAVLTANREGYDVARDMLECGADICTLIDLNTKPCDPDTQRWLEDHGVETLTGHAVTEATPGPGNRSISGIRVQPLREDGQPGGQTRQFSCDTLITSAGYSPQAQLLCHSGGRMVHDDAVNSFRIENIPAHAHIAGSVNHKYLLEAVQRDGRTAGRAAAAAAGRARSDPSVSRTSPPGQVSGAQGVNHPFPVFVHNSGKDFVDFDEDITVADLHNAVSDGFDHPELAKRYSTAAMGPSQGRLSALNVMRVVQNARTHAQDEAEVTTQRPPFRPISFGVLAGRSFQPERLTPMHDWHLKQGAMMMPAGTWKRPAYYGAERDRQQHIVDEVAAVRTSAGLIDVSTLGGIEIRGPDAAPFLNRLYTFAYLKQEVGRTRYLLMADESGSIIDDGVACRLAEDYFYVTTTTTGSDSVYRNMLRLIAEWQMNVEVINVTSAYAAMNIVGPKSREVVDKVAKTLGSDMDFNRDAFPYLGGRHGRLGTTDVLAMRIGFVGELGYELHIPWSGALAIWEALFQAGEPFGLRPVGVEAQRVLRLEKGHIIVGQDTDGLTFPAEADLSWAVSQNKKDFIGKAAIEMLDSRPITRRLTGFKLLNSGDPIPEECHLVVRGNDITGRVTSVARSEAIDETIGLAYVAPDQAMAGQIFDIKIGNGEIIKAESVAVPFYDPDNQRQQL